MNRSVVMIVVVDLAARNAPSIHVLNVAKQLSLRNWDVTIIAPRFSKSLPVDIASDRIALRLTPNLSNWFLPNSFNTLLQLPLLFRLNKDCSVLLRSSPLSLPVVGLAKILRFRSITVEYNGWFSDEMKSLGQPRLFAEIFSFLQRYEAKIATNVRVVTLGLKKILVSHNIPKEKISVIQNGADISLFDRVARRDGLARMDLPDDRRYLAFVGNLWPPVDMETVFKAMAMLKDEQRKIELLIVGNGRSQADFKQRASELDVADRVRFLGALDQAELKYVLAVSDAGVVTLHSERNERIGVSPLKIYEYASCGKPVIATNMPGLSDMSDEKWLTLVPPGDSKAWRDAIVAIMEIRDARELNDAARMTAEKKYSWKSRGAQIATLLSRRY